MKNQLSIARVEPARCAVDHAVVAKAEASLSPMSHSYHSELMPLASFDGLYSSLQTYQIRLLRLEPGDGEDLIETRLMTADLLYDEGVVISATREWTAYEAVSYSWGYPEPTHVIVCNDQVIPILKTQFEMLRSFRDPLQHRYLWVDAICINQSDKTEKSLQIQKMFSIFRKAKSVPVWLDHEAPRDQYFFNIFMYLDAGQTPVSEASKAQLLCNKCISVFIPGMNRLKCLPWFKRTWVRQEVFAAREISLHIGTLKYELRSLTELGLGFGINNRTDHTTVFSREPMLHLSSHRAIAMLQSPDERRDTLAWTSLISHMLIARTLKLSHDGDLASILANSSHYQASDIRDIIYGILGMTNVKLLGKGDQDNVLGLVVDYNRSISQVFKDATRYLIRREEMLDAMYLAQYFRPEDQLDLPSWCPNWRKVQSPGIKPLPNLRLVPGADTRETTAKSFLTIVEPSFFDKQDRAQPDLDPDHPSLRHSETDLLTLAGDVFGIIRLNHTESPKFRLEPVDEVVFSKIPQRPAATEAIPVCGDYVELQMLEDQPTSGEQTTSGERPTLGEQPISGENPARLTIIATIKGIPTPIDVVLACVPAHTQPGDLLCYLAGGRTFTILRPSSVQSDFCRCRFIGTAYVARGLLPVQRTKRVAGVGAQNYYLHDYKGPKFVVEAFHNYLRGMEQGMRIKYFGLRTNFDIE